MYHAKRAGTSGWQLYVEGMHDPSAGGTALEDAHSGFVALR
jgi:hypothetical protein